MKFDDFLEATLNAVQNTDKVVESVVISLNEWDTLYAKALKENPRLAGEMLGYRQGNLKGIPTGGVVLTGSGLALAKSMVVLKSGIASSGKALEEIVMKLPNLQTGKVINPHIDLSDLSKSLPKGYEYISASEVKGPKGSIYHLIGRDADGNPVYFNNNKFVSFEDGVKK